MEETTTTDFAKFGHRERKEAERLLHEWNENGLPEDFCEDEVVIMFNFNSGCVFLTNSDFQAALLNGDKLESFYSCPECGNEGFKEDLENEEYSKECCREYLLQTA
jgi:hypothetical protein